MRIVTRRVDLRRPFIFLSEMLSLFSLIPGINIKNTLLQQSVAYTTQLNCGFDTSSALKLVRTNINYRLTTPPLKKNTFSLCTFYLPVGWMAWLISFVCDRGCRGFFLKEANAEKLWGYKNIKFCDFNIG